MRGRFCCPSIMFIESPDGDFHISLRSKNVVDVSEIALRFGGGGHARAAGCSISNMPPEQLMSMVITEAKAAATLALAD